MANSEGAGKAADAQVKAADDAETINQEDPRPMLEAAVKGAEAKVERQKEHLSGAEDALADAKRALKEL